MRRNVCIIVGLTNFYLGKDLFAPYTYGKLKKWTLKQSQS